MLKKLIIISALLGYVAGYSSVYLFHILLILWVAKVFFESSRGRGAVLRGTRYSKFFIILFIYCAATVFWIPDVSTWARYMFYLVCGYASVFIVSSSGATKEEMRLTFKVIAVVALLNLMVGLVEMTGLARLPMSPYSPYVSFFGRSPSDLAGLSDYAIGIVDKKPTGFNWNPNNFGFVVLLIAPFLILAQKRVIVWSGLAVCAFLLVGVASKGLFLAFLLMLGVWPIFSSKSIPKFAKNALIVFPVFLVGWGALVYLGDSVYGVNRILGTFQAIDAGLENISLGGSSVSDSTGVRSDLYLAGWNYFIESYGLGLGWGGVEALLNKAGFEVFSLHFFFFQLLLDLGLIPFLILLSSYFYLAAKLFFISRRPGADRFLVYLAKASSMALLVAIPASIAPSGVHYVLSFYVLVGIAVTVLRLLTIEARNTRAQSPGREQYKDAI